MDTTLKGRVKHGIPPRVWATLEIVRKRKRLWNAKRAIASYEFAHGSPHNLPGELIVSLTSYPKRFPTLANTLKSLLAQSIKADRIVLWVAFGDRELVPDEVLDLPEPLEVRTCEDLRSYKKIIPSLQEWPDAYICTADDDIYYPRDWLRTLVSAVRPGVIPCRRAHRPRYEGGTFAPYGTWEWCVVTSEMGDLFPTSGAGAIYSPGSLSCEVLDPAFLRLCPHADDVWLYMMGKRAGSVFQQVGGVFHLTTWPGSQQESLMTYNLDGGNDRQIAAVRDFLEGHPAR